MGFVSVTSAGTPNSRHTKVCAALTLSDIVRFLFL